MALSSKQIQIRKEKKLKKRKSAIAQKANMQSKLHIYEAVLTNNIWDTGLGVGCLALENNKGDLFIANFKIDVFCLGIKDSFNSKISFEQYTFFKENQELGDSYFTAVEPGYLKSLIVKSAEYAKQYGFLPQGDFNKSMKYFQDVRLPDISPDFAFGKDGKPYYVAGPYDSVIMSRRVINKLHDVVGINNFNYLVPIPEELLFAEDVYEIINL